jgi:hypothetical protein
MLSDNLSPIYSQQSDCILFIHNFNKEMHITSMKTATDVLWGFGQSTDNGTKTKVVSSLLKILWRVQVLETPFGMLLRLFTTSLVVTTISFTMCALHFPVVSLSWFVIWLLAFWLLLWSDSSSLLTLRLWSAPLICPVWVWVLCYDRRSVVQSVLV